MTSATMPMEAEELPEPGVTEDLGGSFYGGAQNDMLARHMAPFAKRLLLRHGASKEADRAGKYREQLRAQGIVGASEAIAHVLRQMALVAPLDVGILLTGASGTGKTQVARGIHESGPRRGAPFVEINCATLPEALAESELFGVVPGAHSTATRRMEGRVGAAGGGTLFFDEVAELHPAMQAKLLQLLESKEYCPLGSSRVKRADVRVIAASNVDLEMAVKRREFREDLFYRLKVLTIRLPSLSERREDICLLLRHFSSRSVAAHRLPPLTISTCAQRAAETADWPGNVRELAHAVESAAIRAAGDGATEILSQHLFPEKGAMAGVPVRQTSWQEATRQFQEGLLRRVLEETGWNITETAARLGLARSHVYNLIRLFGIERGR